MARPVEAAAAPGRELRLHRFPGAVLDRAFLPPGTTLVDAAADPDIVAIATGRRVPAAVQRQIARARRRFGWRPLLVAHYGEIEARPAANLADLDAVFSFAPSGGRNTRHERYWRMPLLASHVADREALAPGGLWARPKTRFCNFIYSNRTLGNPGAREAFARALMRRGPVDCPGAALRNVHPLPPNAPGSDAGARAKLDYLASYRFTIAFEHVRADHYLSEKLLHALVAGSIPIYWGCPQVAEYYNPACFVNCHDFPSFDAAIEHVLAIEADPDRAEAMRRSPLLLPGSRIAAAHADLEARWRMLAEEAWARRRQPAPRGLGRVAALAAKSLAMEADLRPRLAGVRRGLLTLARRTAPAVRDRPKAVAAAARAAWIQFRDEAAHVRGWRTAARFCAWWARRCRWLLVRRRWATPLAHGVGSARAAARRAGGQMPRPTARGGPRQGLGAAAPGFDPRRCNPVGWTANVERRVIALGCPDRLPRGARRAVDAEDAAALRHAHHVADTAACHVDAAARAATLARLAARGVPVHVQDGDAALRAGLGCELHDLMTAGVPLDDGDAREALSIRMRRLAHRDHARRDGPWPVVSVLLATRRPGRLRQAVAQVAAQGYPRLELVLALHGDGFGDLPACPGLALRVVRVARERPLGVALAVAADLASGELLAKMDDDDLYGADHILDLVLARAYSGAELVGKGPETVYLAGRGLTVRRGRWRAERFTDDIAGGGLLLAARDLERAGGWRPLPQGVDQALAADVQRAGGAVYRTHGKGFVLVRHGHGHAWAADERRFLADADAVGRGWRPDWAGLADAARPAG